LTQSACGAFTLNGQTYSTSGVYTQTLLNAAGCDSTITLNLTIRQATSSSLTQSACGAFTLNGQNYTASGVYTQIRTNAAGCDSTITLNLTINTVDTVVIVNNATLSANATGASYQWVDCNNNTPIAGETGQSFTPTLSGNYAVEITENGCSALSNCYNVVVVGIESLEEKEQIQLFPNPATDEALLELELGVIGDVEIALYNNLGQLLNRTAYQNIKKLQHRFDLSMLPSASYWVMLKTANGQKAMALLKK
jgi:hypothetical protein